MNTTADRLADAVVALVAALNEAGVPEEGRSLTLNELGFMKVCDAFRPAVAFINSDFIKGEAKPFNSACCMGLTIRVQDSELQ